MRIKIVKLHHENVWYRNKIGQEYEVTDIGNGLYQRVNNHFYKLFASDCVVVSGEAEKIEIPELTTDIAWFIGYITGDSCVETSEDGIDIVSIYVEDGFDKVYKQLEKVFNSFGVTSIEHVKSYIRAPIDGLPDYIKKIVRQVKGRVIPDYIKEGIPDIKKAFLAGLFDSIGGILIETNTGDSFIDIAYISTSQSLLDDTIALYNSVGIANIESVVYDAYTVRLFAYEPELSVWMKEIAPFVQELMRDQID